MREQPHSQGNINLLHDTVRLLSFQVRAPRAPVRAPRFRAEGGRRLLSGTSRRGVSLASRARGENTAIDRGRAPRVA